MKQYYGSNVLSKFGVCDSKYLRFIKEQEATASFNNLELKTPLSDIR